METLIVAILSGFIGFMINNIGSRLKLKERLNEKKIETYKNLLQTWINSRNTIVEYMLTKKTEEESQRRIKAIMKLDKTSVSSSALISEAYLYCTDEKLVDSLIEINNSLFLTNNWFAMSDDEINNKLEQLKSQVFETFSKLRDEIETSSMFTYTDIKSFFRSSL